LDDEPPFRSDIKKPPLGKGGRVRERPSGLSEEIFLALGWHCSDSSLVSGSFEYSPTSKPRVGGFLLPSRSATGSIIIWQRENISSGLLHTLSQPIRGMVQGGF